MKKIIKIETKEPVILQCTDLVFSQKPYWCNATRVPLKMSILHQRAFFEYDDKPAPQPCILWITGGGWTEVDQNVWLPELSYYAKKGYVVASVSYSLPATWFFPEMLMDVKQAIRYLRAHASEWNIDPDRIAVMGESAGGHLASLVAATGDRKEFEKGEYLDKSSAVQSAVIFYGAVDMMNFEGRESLDSYDEKEQFLLRGKLEPQSVAAGVNHLRYEKTIGEKMDPRFYITKDTPPFLLLHGTKDTQVPVFHSEILYEKLEKEGVPAEFILIDGVDHADAAFLQTEVKNLILDYLNRTLK